MNVLTDEIEEIAESIKLRIISRRGTWTVYVRDDGSVAADRIGDTRRSRDLPDAWMVGRYTRAASVPDIEDDLVFRRRELRKVAA